MNSTKTKQRKPKLNVRLLRKIQKHILEEPRRFFMSWFVSKGKPGGKVADREPDQAATFPLCGTTACIAGWAVLLSDGMNANPRTFTGRATTLLNLPIIPGNLFIDQQWPEPFRSQYDAAKTPSKRAKIAAARIEHLITKGE